MDMPPEMGAARLNSFFVLTDGADWDSEQFGRTYADYLNGHYWTRQKISPNSLKGEWGALAIERIGATAEGDYMQEICNNFVVTVGQLEKCANCPDEDARTQIQVDESNRYVLQQIIREFKTYHWYDLITAPDESTAQGWLSDGRAQYLRDQGYTLSAPMRSIIGNIYFDQLANNAEQYLFSNFEGVDRMFAMSVELRVCDCNEDDIAYNYITQGDPNKQYAVAGCDTCLRTAWTIEES